MADAVRTDRGPTGDRPAAERQLEQLRFLHRVAKLATTARTWDELLETIVDETRDALHADVSSLYLLDRDGSHLTLAATNGLDRYQIGRARVPLGEGVVDFKAILARVTRARNRRADACDFPMRKPVVLHRGEVHADERLEDFDRLRPLKREQRVT